MNNEQNNMKEEQYEFLQEVIKDETTSPKKRKKTVMRGLAFGVCAGLAACITFLACKPLLEVHFFDETETVTIPDEEEAAEKAESNSEDNQESETTVTQTKEFEYQQMLSELKSVSTNAEKSMVDVIGYQPQNGWESAENEAVLSGVLLADNGKELLILANDSLVREEFEIRVRFQDGECVPAKVKKRDRNLGLCIYTADKGEIPKDTRKYIELATLGSSNALKTGETLIVQGKPFGNDKGVAYGTLVSSAGLADVADGKYHLVSTDLSSHKDGNGVIFDEEGKVVGILSASDQRDGAKRVITGYAISDIKRAIELLSNGKGVPYVGICAADVTEDLQENGIPVGVYVRKVQAESPAMEAGIQSGDVITKIDDTEITNYESYYNYLMSQKQGEKIHLTGFRPGADGKHVEIGFDAIVGVK